MDVPIAKDRTITLPPMASPDHLVLMGDGSWKPFKELQVGDQIAAMDGCARIVAEIPITEEILNLKRR